MFGFGSERAPADTGQWITFCTIRTDSTGSHKVGRHLSEIDGYFRLRQSSRRSPSGAARPKRAQQRLDRSVRRLIPAIGSLSYPMANRSCSWQELRRRQVAKHRIENPTVAVVLHFDGSIDSYDAIDFGRFAVSICCDHFDG